MEKQQLQPYLKWMPAHVLIDMKYISYSQINKLKNLGKLKVGYLQTTLMIDMSSLEDSITPVAVFDKQQN